MIGYWLRYSTTYTSYKERKKYELRLNLDKYVSIYLYSVDESLTFYKTSTRRYIASSLPPPTKHNTEPTAW